MPLGVWEGVAESGSGGSVGPLGPWVSRRAGIPGQPDGRAVGFPPALRLVLAACTQRLGAKARRLRAARDRRRGARARRDCPCAGLGAPWATRWDPSGAAWVTRSEPTGVPGARWSSPRPPMADRSAHGSGSADGSPEGSAPGPNRASPPRSWGRGASGGRLGPAWRQPWAFPSRRRVRGGRRQACAASGREKERGPRRIASAPPARGPPRALRQDGGRGRDDPWRGPAHPLGRPIPPQWW